MTVARRGTHVMYRGGQRIVYQSYCDDDSWTERIAHAPSAAFKLLALAGILAILAGAALGVIGLLSLLWTFLERIVSA